MKYYITTPIYYPNSSPHIGTAYTTIAADAMARLRRMKGDDVYFLTGTDENAQKIVRTAENAGMDPLTYVDGIVDKFKEFWRLLDISNDDFIRTTEERHAKVVQQIFTRLYEKGDIYKSEYEGWYCTPCETFWTENKLVDGKCPNPDCGRNVELLKEESYFFRMSKYSGRLLQYIQDHPDFIQPASRRNEMIRFIEGGLEDLCVSRTTFQWGIKVPFDPKHVVYVWLDALINYISALGYPDGEKYKTYWPASVHLVGKDIVRFHTIIWPIILMALDLPLPEKVFGHGWFLSKEGGKISKSRGNVQDSFQLIQRYGADPIRYFLLRELQYGLDGTFSEDDLVEKLNSNLANDLGNFVSRTLAMVVKYRNGIVPEPGENTDLEREIRDLSSTVKQGTEEKMLACDTAAALEVIWQFVSRCNKYVDETAPWNLAKSEDNQDRLDTVLYTFMECIRILGILCAPFMPGVPRKIKPLLGDTDFFKDWEQADSWNVIQPGTAIRKGEAIFPRIDVSAYLEQVNSEIERCGTQVQGNTDHQQEVNLEVSSSQPENPLHMAEMAPLKEEISIEEFAKMDFRVVKVLQAEKVEKADKLLKLEVEMGGERRTIVSGIAQHYSPEALVGKKVILVANLKPAKLRGIMSQGMILAASQDGELEVLTVQKDLPTGAQVK
ncbi:MULTISPECIES: methionine--tRNA ligase [unclassified Dehalobacter]|uniref:methionine--tRNA ligase n=1 Tax=unclassified Dehalobacter TaxID=2635733 RepID=UPI000E6D27FB|nr:MULTISPECIES: methionine--tRNA ligase [unclassified Dehalobacter]RJE47841.1 methionine--tRNA ligase [Dehalobacter sp. MCB1]TCX49007.1 methionine--tRNA ligase [Dehalobacter sp. 14DCB1]TCX56671.1 methionine--tRNA ligase [Dehalobacter sp. 12DCB1]